MRTTPKQVTAENTTYVYFANGDALPSRPMFSFNDGGGRRVVKLRGYSESLDAMPKFLATNSDIRLVLVPGLLDSQTVDVEYLYWNDGTDLDALDTKVDCDSYTDDDFRNSIKTHYQKALCTSCGSEWDTLVVDTGEPYAGAPGLLQQKLRRQSVGPCPNCNTDFRLSVVKVLF